MTGHPPLHPPPHVLSVQVNNDVTPGQGHVAKLLMVLLYMHGNKRSVYMEENDNPAYTIC